jgi:tetratricopeptide (TPR) repeat protein
MGSLKEMKELLAHYREEGNEQQVANLAYKLGDAYRERREWDRASSLLEEALSLCRKHGNESGEAIVALSLGELHLEQEDMGRAQSLAEHALRFYAEHQEDSGTVRASQLLGDIYWAMEEPEGALPHYREALRICVVHDDTMGAAFLSDRAGKMYRLLNQEERALGLFQDSLAGWQKLGVPDREAMTLVNMGDIHRRLGDITQATRCHEEALSIYQRIRHRENIRALEKALQELRPIADEIQKETGDPKKGSE